MTDLNPSLTDFDKSLITEAPKPPELKPFSVWSEENQLTEADPQSYVQYSDYVREGYLEQGAYTPSVEGEISGSLNSKLADLGVVDEEAIQALTATKEPSFEEKFEYVRAGLNSDDEDWMTLTEYKAGEKVVAAGGTVQPYQDKIAGLKLKSEEVVNRRFDEVKRNLVESNQIPLAYVTNETGERELLVGDAAENMTVNQAIKASKIGGVSFKDGLAAQALLSPVAGLDIKLYKFKQIAEISESIAELAQQDSSVAEHVTGHTLQLARESQNAWDATTQSLTRGLSDLMTAVGVESEESNDEKKRVYIASRQSFDNTVEYITDKLNSSGANYKAEDVRDAYEAHVIHEGARRGTFKLHQDPSEAGKNLYKTALGPVLNPAVFAREEDMINTLAAHPELTAQQKKLFIEKRVDVLKQNFASYSKLLSESAVGDDWAKALIDGRQAGRDDLDIFDDFVAKDENFNEYLDSAKGIAYSVWDSVATLVYAAPAIMGADWAKDGLADAVQRQSDRREVAQIFGEQYGLFQDVSESVAPLIVDIAATTALATVSGGTLGAGYLALRTAAKGGAQLTAKGFAKALTSNVLRASTKQGYKEVADKAANVLIRESLEKGGRAKTIEAIEAFNKVASSKFNIGVAGFVPAATRSGAMTYASLYNQLRKDPELSEDEAHDRALGFALTSGAITGAITAGFSMIGRGGVEDALLKGMTFRESKAVFQAMGNTSGISDTLVAGAMKTVMNASIKKYGAFALGKKIAKNAVDESLEEGLDQLVNSFVEDVALNQDTPMLERMTQVWHAAQVGGILGGGVPTIQAGARFVGYTPMDQRESRIRMANEFAEQVSSELEGTGSPLTAQQVRQIIKTRAQSRGAAEAAAELAPTPSEGTSTVTEQSLLREENAKRSKEIAQEISKLSDESTLPKKEEEREAEVALREQRRIELEQESAAISQKEQNLEVAAQSPTTPDFTLTDQKVDPVVFLQSLNDSSPLDVEIALENIRNQQSVSVRNSEPVTVLETPFDYGRKSPREIKDYTGPYIDFTQEQANAESAGVTLQGESRTNISSANNSVRGFDPSKSKRYSSRPSPNTFRYEESPFSGPDAEEKANRLIGFAMSNGFPINPDPNVNYGLPMPSDSSRQSASEFVSSAVYTAYPKLAPPKNAKLDPDNEKRPLRTYFDPVSGTTVTQPVKFFVDDRGNGVFDNDPISIIEMLRAGKTVKVPRSFNRANLNPAIRIKNEMVTDVVGPTAEGTLLESKVTNARGVSTIGPNNTRASAIANIRFKPATLPEGVQEFDKNGSPTTDSNFSDTTSIKRRINRFALELEKTGDETNRNAQALLEAGNGELNEEFRMVAFESAKQEFLFNAQLFGLRAKVEAFGEGTNPTTPFDELVAQTGSKNVDQAAQKLLPFIKVESNKELTGEAILGLFVEQKLLNNPDFANNTTPTFDTLLKKAANRFKNQQEEATSLRQQRAASTLPFDITPDQFKNPKVSSWVFNFGENPVGDFASPQDISNTVSGAMKKAVNAVNTSPDLRKGIVKVILEDVLEDPEMEDMVENASSKDLFGIFASWLSSGNGDTRPSVNNLVEMLEDKVLIGSEDFLNALQLVRLVTPSDGASYENSDAVSDFQAQFNAGAETEITAEEAKNTMIALTKAVRTHLSRSNITDAERGVITAKNKADIERLGLESGNPDSVIEALKEVAKNSKIPSHKFVAALLLRDTASIKKIKFVMGEAKADIAGKYVKGKDGSDSVFINITSGNGRGLVNTLLEEYVHAFISGTISNPPSSKQGIVNQLSSVFDFAKETYESQKEVSGPVPSLENALTDLNEFTAQFLLSEDVQKHFKNLKPTNNSSPFDSFLINIAMLFPNVGIGSAREVAESLGDIIDVGSNPRKGPPTNAGALAGAIANNATLSSSPVFSPEYMAERKAERREALREMQDETEEKRLESKRLKDEVEREKFLSLIPEEDRSEALPLLNYLRGLIPFGMELEFVTESDGSSSFVRSDSSAVYINLPLMLSQTGGVRDIAGRAIAGVIINEELVHSASWSSMTDEEIQDYINSLSDSDFVDIAKEYYIGNEPRIAAAIASLQSSDPQVVARAKYGLAQEKLRMHFQKVTRGFTTEDDVQFWKSKPSLLKILGRYFRGIINRWVAKREQIGPAADVALNKLIIEMRAIEAGFVRQPTKMAFDTKNPTEVFQMFEVVNQDFVGLAQTPQTMDDGSPQTMDDDESYLTPDQLQNLNNVRNEKSQKAPEPIHSEFSPVVQAANNLADGFNLSNGTSVTLERGENGSVLFEAADRAFVVVNLNGSRVGFYQSTGKGGKKLQSGKWYPTAGPDKGGKWINKTSSEAMAAYYGSRALAEIASKLDNTLGNVERFVSRTDNGSSIRDIRSQQGTAENLSSPEFRARVNPDGRETFSFRDGRVFQAVKDLAAEFDSAAGMGSPQRYTTLYSAPFSSQDLQPVNEAQNEIDDALLNGRDAIDTGIKGSAVHELAKFMDRLIPTKDKIDWQKNWRGSKKSFKDIPRKEKAFYKDIDNAGTRLVGVLQRALNEYPDFVSWYEERVNMAMDIFAELDPDASKPEDDFILKTLMTITSNGNKVKEQTEDSWSLYQNWKKTGKLVPASKYNPDRTQIGKNGKEVSVSWIRGDRQNQIKSHLALVDKLISNYSWEVVSEFFSRSGTRAELISDLVETFGYTRDKASDLTSGELMDEQVPYSLIFGAKLGSFYNNLNGDFDTVTMDRWFMRTFGRTIGAQLRKYNRKEMAEKHARFDKALAKYLELDPKATLFKFADSQRSAKSKLDPIGRKRKRSNTMVLALDKHYTKASNRQLAFNPETGTMEEFSGKMEKASPITNELRLATNQLSKAVDSFELIEAPSSGGHRRFIRLAMRDALGKLEQQHGIEMVPAEAQAILWYYEKALHAQYGSGKDGEAPDYATAANEVFKDSRGTGARSFRESTANIRRGSLQQSVGRDIGGYGQADSDGPVILGSAPVEGQPVAGFPSLLTRSGKLAKPYDLSKDPVGKRRPEGQAELSRELAFGLITPEEYQEQYDERFGAPVTFTSIPKPATTEEIFNAVRGETKKGRTIRSEDIPSGRYKVRLDIPAYTDHDVWVVVFHENTPKATALHYTSSAILNNVTFDVKQKVAAATALRTDKTPMAKMVGDYESVTAKEAESLAKEAINSTEWVEIGMNPYRHSYFYDKANQDPLVSAEQVVQVGGAVYAKGVEYGSRTETMEDGSRQFLYSAPLSAAPSSKPTGSTINFSAVVDLLEVPVYELETGKPQNFIMEFLNKVFAGELPEAFRRLIQNRDAYKRLTEANVVAYKQEMDKLIEENYGGYEYAPMDLIALAQGHYTGNIVTEEVLKDIDKDYDAAHADAEKKRKAGEITEEEADFLKGLAHNRRTKATDKAYREAITSRKADRDAALRELAKESPKLAAHIIDIRQRLIIPLQKKLVKSGLDDNIGVKISETGGVYITRSYKMFTDSSYLQKVREDPNYQVVRDEAMRFFDKQFKDKKFEELVDGGMDKSRAEVEAGILLDIENQSYPHSSYAQEVLNTFLMRYDEGGRDSTTAAPKHYKMIEDNLKRRKDLPVEIRNLLGEIGSEAGIDLILRTYSTVATLASQQAFLNQLVAFGKETGVMVTVEEKFATAENRAKYANFGAARSGAPSKNDPLSGMLVDPEFKKLLDTTLNDSFSMDYADTAEKAVKGVVGLAANLSGKAMAAKTLGSIGFYLRNGIGNLLFGTSQGFLRYDKMIAEMAKGTVGVFKDGKIDPELNELIGLNIKGDELRAGIMRDLLNGRVTPDGIRKQIEDLGEKTKLNIVTKGLAIIEKKAQDLSAALDAAYKVAYYNHELAILKEAQAADTSTVEDGKVRVNNLAAMSDTQIKRLAARKVVMTSQAYSQAPPAVTEFTKSGLGLLFAPFIRFKVEVPRIVINTYKLASEEIASGNPVLVRRGKTRMIWMTGTIGVLSSALPMILAALSGIGDEEDEAMRASIPDYLRGHTFFYYRWNGELKSVDLTYVNPYSLLVDPFLRAYENIRSGEFTEAGAALALGLVRDQYLDDQILAGAVSEARRNLNPSTGKPIWNKGADGPVEAGSKILGYIAKEAYAPRLGKDFVEGWSTGSLTGMGLEIMDGAMPFRIHDVDLQKQYSRYLLDLNKRYNNVKSGLNAVKRNVPMSDGEVADIIDENIEDRRLLNYELMRINKGFSSLGLTDTDLLKGMKDKKLGRDRVALLSKGYMDKPSFKYIIESLLDPRTDEYGRERAQQVYDHASKLNRYIPVRPITEPE